MPRPFLRARWSHLALLTYPVPPALLARRLPRGVEPDTLDGRAFVSLVAFDFLDTRVLGVRFPPLADFPEINLRCYVRGPGPGGVQRGVNFIREFVPFWTVATIARGLYNEPYRAVPMRSRVARAGGCVRVEHALLAGGRWRRLWIDAEDAPFTPASDSLEHYFKEHEWGFGADRLGAPSVYRVEHPTWRTFPVRNWRLDWDFGEVYGPEWNFLNDTRPISVILAEGSCVAVYPKD